MLKNLLEKWEKLSVQPAAVLCSVVQWKGSVPRKDYPLMLVLETGESLGTIGGGSMELKVIQSAGTVLGEARPRLFSFDMSGSSVDADIGLCGGSMQILVEPFTQSLYEFYRNILHDLNTAPRSMLRLDIQGSDFIHVKRTITHRPDELQDPDPAILHKLRDLFDSQQSKAFVSSGQLCLLWQPFSPPRLHIFGAGHVGQAVADLAHFNGLELSVYDDRPALLTRERFPHAQRIPIVFPLDASAFPLLEPSDFILVASREHRHDHALMRLILRQNPAYIGLVSSSRKWKILAASLLQEGFETSLLDQVRAPVGSAIGAETVPEIATSILSQIISVYRKQAHG